MSWKWSKQRRVATVWGPKASSAYPHQRESVYPGTGHCRRWKFHFYSLLDRVGHAAFTLDLDTAAGGNFISTRVWTELGKLKLQHAQWRCRSASKHPLPIIGVFTADAKYGDVSKSFPVSFLVSEIPVCICLVGMLLEPCGSPWN